MRFGKVKAHAGQACRVSKLNGRIFLVLGKPAFSLLPLWAAFWSIHAVVKSNAFAQDIPLAFTTSAIQSAIRDNDVYTHAWWSGVHEISTNGADRKSEIAYASDRRLGNTFFRDRNQFGRNLSRENVTSEVMALRRRRTYRQPAARRTVRIKSSPRMAAVARRRATPTRLDIVSSR